MTFQIYSQSLDPCVLLQESGYPNEALECYNNSIDKGADKNKAYYNIATIYFNAEKYQLAKSAGDLAVLADTTKSNGYCIRGYARYKLGEKDNGLIDLMKAYNKNENDQGVVVTIVLLLEDYWGQEEIATQLHFCNKAVELDPHNALMYKRRGILRMLSGKKQFGCLDLKKAIDLGQTDLISLYGDICN